MVVELNSSSYYHRRAAEARALAFAATMQGVRKIHLEMATHYDRLAAEGEADQPDLVAYAPAARTSASSSQ